MPRRRSDPALRPGSAHCPSALQPPCRADPTPGSLPGPPSGLPRRPPPPFAPFKMTISPNPENPFAAPVTVRNRPGGFVCGFLDLARDCRNARGGRVTINRVGAVGKIRSAEWCPDHRPPPLFLC